LSEDKYVEEVKAVFVCKIENEDWH